MTNVIAFNEHSAHCQALAAIILDDQAEPAARVKDAVCELANAEIAAAEQRDIERADGVRTTSIVAREALDGVFEGFLWTLRAVDPENHQQLAAHYLDRMTVEARGGRAAA